MEGAKFNFVHLPTKTCKTLTDKNNLELLMKWSMKGNLKVQHYNFNQPFQSYLRNEFVENFFKDTAVYSTLEVMSDRTWQPIGTPAERVEIEFIPCTISSMSFFSRIKDPDSNVVRGNEKNIILCMEEQIDGFYVNDNLRGMLLDQSNKCYGLFSSSDRGQFIFNLFKHFVLGGQWCQQEDTVQPYLDITKSLYKEIISVERVADSNEITVRSIVLKVVAYGPDNVPLLPKNPDNIQNFTYLIIDPFKRQVAVLMHQYEGVFYC